ncbi:MAG: M1 family aminopeptidase [Chryseolinea sp.]
MFPKIFLFEIRYRLKRPATYAYFGILFLFGILTASFGGINVSEKTYVNSAFAISRISLIVSMFEMLIASAIMGVPVYRDIEYKTKDYYFTYPITDGGYLMGRYLGSFVILVLISFGFHLGLISGFPIGLLREEFEPERLGPFVLQHYAYAAFIFTIPNILFSGTIFFSLVALTRNIKVTYVGSVVLFIGYLLASTLSQDLDNTQVVGLLDPFAVNTHLSVSKYWTPAEQNVMLAPLEGTLLWNRILWVGLSLALLAFTYFKFSFKSFLYVASGKKENELAPTRVQSLLRKLPEVNKYFSTPVYVRKLFRQSLLEFRNIIKDAYFVAILFAALLFLFLDGWFTDSIYGTPSLPVTYYLLDIKNFDYIIFVFIIIIFYTGEVVHRDKSVNYSNVADALPVPNWVMYGSKFLSMVLVAFILINLVIVMGVLNQTVKGYFNYEFWMYFTDLYLIEFPEYIQLVMLAFIVHILVNNKFMGHVITIGIWVVMFSLRNFAELDYNLFFYSYSPGYTISDMNGFGHFMKPMAWFNFYWLSLGMVFLIIGNLFWNRGSETSFDVRWKVMKQRFNSASAAGLTLFTVLWLGSGAFIYYNVSVLNTYRTSDERKKIDADFEKTYKKYEFRKQPKVVDAKVYVDIYAYDRAAKAKGDFTIVNKSNVTIDSLILNIGSPIPFVTIEKITNDKKELNLVLKDEVNRFYIYKLPVPLAPGDTTLLQLQIDARYKGFTNGNSQSTIVYNGTFMNLDVFPTFGYPGDPMTSDKDRKKYGLPKKEYSLPPQTDPLGLSNFLFTDDGDWITYEATISTEEDQLAISPGYLQKTWKEGGRSYYHYKMDNEIDLFANFSSARYDVLKDKWSGNGKDVNIEIIHHPAHKYNLDRFVKGVKASLSYYSENFSPYQFHQMRILEFPRYASFAQSFPNTVPYSESFGWVGDFTDPEDTDYAFYVTAHEVAHQWWGHQVMPSATRGANQISESMAEYSALMVLKHEYGDEAMQRFLKYDLDSYLRGRAGESKFEATLLDNDTRAYVWYRKGSLILYALQDLVGEEKLNKAFKTFVDSAAFRQKPPYATSNEWYEYLSKAVPDSLHYYLEDSFEKITLYENRLTKATYEPFGDKFKAHLTVQSKKVYYDGLGKELEQGKEVNLIDIGIFLKDDKNKSGMTKKVPLYLKKHWVKPGEQIIEVIVDSKPLKAGIDPYNKLIDRIPDDNVKNFDN